MSKRFGKFTSVIVAVLAAVLLAGIGLDAQTLWPKKHRDLANTGLQEANQAPGISDNLVISWTYPWPPATGIEDELVVDDSDTLGLFSATGAWFMPAPDALSPNANLQTYLAVPAAVGPNPSSLVSGSIARARWTVPLQLAGRYQIQVWFPSSTDAMTNSSQVTYRVHSLDGDFNITINQSSYGGQWVPLGSQSYNIDDTSYVEMTNFSSATAAIGPPIPGQPGEGLRYVDQGRYAIADAVRFVLDNGSIYSSPAVFQSGGLPFGANEAVVFGTVDRDAFGREADAEITWGRVVCVDAKAGPGRTGNPANNVLNRPLWEYPRLSGRDDLEGPIAGGVYSSPLVIGGTVYIGSDDSQIYALDATTGRLKWTGPGVTLDDRNPGGSNNFSTVSPAGAYHFGQQFSFADTSASGGSSVVYEFSGLPDMYYAVYAWIPPPPPGVEWAPDAQYKIDASTQTTVKVNQGVSNGNCSLTSADPRWVRVGSSYFVGSGSMTVTLTNASQSDACRSGNDLAVVADAVRLIPESIGAFGYCAPSANSLSGLPARIFSANSAGRIVALDATTGAIDWIYPEVRTATSELDDAPLGGMACTVAVSGNDLYYTSTGGKAGKIDGINGASPSLDWEGLLNAAAQLEDLGSVTSSPMVDGSYVYFATSRGYLYRVGTGGVADPNDDSLRRGDIDWKYPDTALGTDPTSPPTAGAFRYSTPSKISVDSQDYVVIGSSDGYFHQVPDPYTAGTASLVRKIIAPGSIYSSPATVPGTSLEPEVAYVGSQSSVVMGFNLDPNDTAANWGWSTLAGELFSSPAVAEDWLYIGGDDGRMYAFGNTASGGGWPVGDPSIGDPPGERYDEDKSGGSAYFDLEVVSQVDYNSPEGYFLSSNVLDDSGVNRQPHGAPSDRLEWGETIYLIAWTFENPNANIKFEMQNVGQGEQAGVILTATQAATHKYPSDGSTITVKLPDGTEGNGVVYYAKFAWVLDPNKLLTPGSQYTIRGILTRTSTATKGQGTLMAVVPQAKTVASEGLDRAAQIFTINHPLALSFPTLGTNGPGWNASGGVGGSFVPTRTDPGTDYNGTFSGTPVPVISPPAPARHGANSIPQEVRVADRSMLGYTRPNNPQGIINSFRAGRGDLGFNSSPINPMPWELVPSAGVVNASPDYPDIPNTRLLVEKRLDGADPTRGATYLIPTTGPATSPSADQRRASPDPLNLTVEVPKYQPPNRPGSAYGTRVHVWVDSNSSGTRRGELDLADTRVIGRPLQGSEAYREWDYATDVMPDVNMYAVERTIDLGKRPIGFGVWVPDEFLPFATAPSGSLFETFTVRNDGNVNISNVQLYKQNPLFSDQVQALDLNGNSRLEAAEGYAIPGAFLISTPDPAFNYWTIPGEGSIISKPRVGDIGPVTFQIPDVRQYAYLQATNPGGNIPEPALPLVSIKIPVGTPVGTYAQTVPVVASLQPDLAGTWYTDPSFTLTVNVREARMTDGVTMGSMPNVDNPAEMDPDLPPVGDAQPTGFRLWSGSIGSVAPGPIGMFWTSNRTPGGPSGPSEPWYIYHSRMGFDPGQRSFIPTTSGSGGAQWWDPVTPAASIPSAANAGNMFPGPPQGFAGTIVPTSVKFTSPSVGQDMETGATWVVFVGQADKRDPATSTTRTEYRLFYQQVTAAGLGSLEMIQDQDFSAAKHSPRILPAGNDLFIFWHGGAAGQFKLFYTVNDEGGDPTEWSDASELTLPQGLQAAAEAVPIPRMVRDDDGRGSPDEHIDIVFSGVSRQGDNADIMVARYEVRGSRLDLRDLPRVFGEELKRDPRALSMFASEHMAWRRPSNGQNPPPAATTDTNFPVVQIVPWNASSNSFDPPVWVTDTPPVVDSDTRVAVFDDPQFGRLAIDTSAGTVKFERPISSRDKVIADYTPQTLRLTSGTPADTGPYSFLEKTLRLVNGVDNSIIIPSGGVSMYPVDRWWLFWRQGAGAVHANTIYYKTMRLGLNLGRPVAVNPDGTPTLLEIFDAGASYSGAYEFDWANNRVMFPADLENVRIWVRYRSSDGNTYEEPQGFTGAGPYRGLGWITELPATTLLVDSMVNEGQVYAFADPGGLRQPSLSDPLYAPSLIWVFWASSRVGSTDIYYQTISPNFRSVTRQ